jgi:NAD(P)-dependent dehydrogenase (short-subunit alcohol dehydrogenase family)
VAGYYAAKASLVALARAWARHTAGSGVTVNIVSPGVLDSTGVAPDTLAKIAQSVPGGAPGSPEAVVAPVRFLLSDTAAYVTGAELCVTGGWGL